MPKRDPWEVVRQSFAMEAEEAQAAGSLAYMARVFAVTSLPYRNPGDVPAWARSNGAVTMTMQPGYDLQTQGALVSIGYPYGVIPRLLLAWITTESVRTKEPELKLGRSLSSFMRKLGMDPAGGVERGNIRRLQTQSRRLFRASITTRWELGGQVDAGRRMDVAEEWNLWWDPRAPQVEGLFESTVTVSQQFFRQLIERPVPIDMRALLALRGSPMRLDIYAWLTHRMSYLRSRTDIPWERLRVQFGSTFADTAKGRHRFREDFTKHLMQVLIVYSDARVELTPAGLVLRPSPTHVRRQLPR